MACGLAAGLALSGWGCTRPYYRKAADEEVSEILGQKDKYPDWQIENWHVYPDPQARFADNSDPDRPPKPPDDPAAFCMSPNPQRPPKKAGVERLEGNGYLELMSRWDRENRERLAKELAEERKKDPGYDTGPESIAPPIRGEGETNGKPSGAAGQTPGADKGAHQDRPLPSDQMTAGTGFKDVIEESKARSLNDITGRPTYMLTLDQAAELAMFNSREYQDARENLYLAALPVTYGRFSFVAQAFAAQEAARSYFGRTTPQGQSNNWVINNGTGFSKVLPTGALLLLNFSNHTVFDFFHPRINPLSITTLNFSAFQPFLRGGGEAVTLETLTQAERNLLYSIRAFARFRKQLYVAIASNNGGSISGSTFQPTGVLTNTSNFATGLTNSLLTPGIIQTPPITIGRALFPPLPPGVLNLNNAITPPPSGYLSTMLEKIQCYIDEENIDVLSGILRRYRGLLDGDVVGPLQVQSVEQQLLTGRATLLTDQQQYLQSLDNFKIAIGVPMQLSIEMDDSVLQPLMKQFRRSRAIIENEQDAVSRATGMIDLEGAPRIRENLMRLFERAPLVRGTAFAKRIPARYSQWHSLSDADLKARLTTLQADADKLTELRSDLQKQSRRLQPADEARLRALNAEIDLGNFERLLRLYEVTYIKGGKPVPPADPAGERRRLTDFQNIVYAWQKVLVEARDDQWEAIRNTWPELPRCCVSGVDLINDPLDKAMAAAAQYALTNRLDLMNVRGQVVDSWRQLAVYANSLLGTFTVGYELNSNSPLRIAQPTNIGGSGNSNQLFLNTELPLTRIQERNNYRASLIAYQRQRRALQEAEDLTVQAVNLELYALRQFAESYKLQQRQLELAYLTIDSSLESLQAPVAPSVPGQTHAASDGPAALTAQLLNAQRTLPTSQNALLTIWINYLNFRLQLYRDLELMPLDARGVWIDEVTDCDCGKPGASPGTTLPEPKPTEGTPSLKQPPALPPVNQVPEKK